MEVCIAFVDQFVTLFAEMAPFLLLGFLLAGVIHVWVPNRLYVPKISKPNFKSVLWAAVFGVPLPICSCGVIPTSIAIRREGVSKGASVSFLISTPATGVDSVLATYSLLGLPFAILRPIAAFATALLGGVLTNVATREETAGEVNVADSAKIADGDGCGAVDEKCGCGEHGCCCHDGDCRGNRNGHEHSKNEVSLGARVKETFRYGFVDMVANVSKWLCIGLVLGALIAAFVPNDFFLVLREYPLLCMLAVLVLAMPMYTCATGSIPLALALVAKGITPGAALVLLMAGPATSVASMLVVGKAFGKRTLAAYLISIAGGALFFGLVIDTFFMDTFLSAMLPNGVSGADAGKTAEMGHGALGIFDYICAVFLAILMICSRLPFVAKKSHHGGCGCSGHMDCECRDERGDEHCGGGCHEDDCCDDDCCNEHGKCDDECCGHHDENAAEGVLAVEQKLQPLSRTFKVLGMNCSHCKACVEKAVFMLDGVTFAEANVAKKELYVEGSVDESELKKTIEDAGFEYSGKV